MAETPREMTAAGTEFLAAEHHDQAKLDTKVAAMQDASAPGAAADAPGAAAPPAAVVTLPDESTLKLCASLIKVADRFIVGFTVKELALTADEQQQIAAAAVPVLNEHLPELIKKLASTPEGQFVLVVALIYGSKLPDLMAPKKKPELVPAPPSSPAAAPSSPAAAEVKA